MKKKELLITIICLIFPIIGLLLLIINKNNDRKLIDIIKKYSKIGFIVYNFIFIGLFLIIFYFKFYYVDYNNMENVVKESSINYLYSNNIEVDYGTNITLNDLYEYIDYDKLNNREKNILKKCKGYYLYDNDMVYIKCNKYTSNKYNIKFEKESNLITKEKRN